MSEVIRELFAAKPETVIYKRRSTRPKAVNTVLLGTWLGVVQDDNDGWLRVLTAGPDGWVRAEDTTADRGLKVFFIDVGQGDGCLIETPTRRALVDGGPNKNVHSYLRNWQYRWLIRSGQQVRIDAVFVSHFDADHYSGLTRIIADRSFEFGSIYHNGIARFEKKQAKRPLEYDEDLGRTDVHGQNRVSPTTLLTTFSSLADARKLLAKGGLQTTFRKFIEAVLAAKQDGRLRSMKRLKRGDTVPGFSSASDVQVKVLAPIPVMHNRKVAYPWFTNSSHTRNGHSLVFQLKYGRRTVLLGGDLNSEAEDYLLAKHARNTRAFQVDVAKSCHHGSSDFTVSFMKAVSPFATVISSGDNESYAHPRADAIGCAGRYSRGVRPLVFSTELARSQGRTGEKTIYGMINLRSDGTQLVLAQMKESRNPRDVWDSYTIH